ncbi:MAG: hypothetical protein WC679_14085, partial [Bacteroidales bacterium]
MIIRNGALYSYGGHFPIAYFMSYHNVCAINRDKYSITTSHHQSILFSTCCYPVVFLDTREMQLLILAINSNNRLPFNFAADSDGYYNNKIKKSRKSCYKELYRYRIKEIHALRYYL